MHFFNQYLQTKFPLANKKLSLVGEFRLNGWQFREQLGVLHHKTINKLTELDATTNACLNYITC